MNKGHLKLLTLPFIGGVPSAARCHFPPRRTVFQFFRTMANTNLDSCQPQMKVKSKERLRLIKSKEILSKRRDLDGPATVYLQVLGAGSRDNPASIYLFSEFNR